MKKAIEIVEKELEELKLCLECAYEPTEYYREYEERIKECEIILDLLRNEN